MIDPETRRLVEEHIDGVYNKCPLCGSTNKMIFDPVQQVNLKTPLTNPPVPTDGLHVSIPLACQDCGMVTYFLAEAILKMKVEVKK